MRDAEAQQSGFDPFDRLLLTSNVSLLAVLVWGGHSCPPESDALTVSS
jgi:hypothetical protein